MKHATRRQKKQYLRFHDEGVYKLLHVYVWEMVYGEVPEGMMVDHINGDIYDNRIVNLRLASRSQNCSNAKVREDNTLGLKGITLKPNGSYIARVVHEGKRYQKVSKDIEVVKKWLHDKRLEVHGAFAKD